MTMTFECTDWMRQHCPGVVHVDGTARPQLVSQRDNVSAHRILSEYARLTGLPCLINTSFNMHEEPIVCTPVDAIRAFKLGHLDVLAIGHWIARNPTPVTRRVDRRLFDTYLTRRGPAAASAGRRRC
jgi:carbamoyltransferase